MRANWKAERQHLRDIAVTGTKAQVIKARGIAMTKAAQIRKLVGWVALADSFEADAAYLAAAMASRWPEGARP